MGEWFDPFGLRGSRVDPFAVLSDALRGEGVAGRSVEAVATAVTRRLVGRTLRLESSPPIRATVAHVVEARPASALDALGTAVTEVPIWARLGVVLRDVRIGAHRLAQVDLDAVDLRVVGVAARAVSVGPTIARAEVEIDELGRWAESLGGERPMSVIDGHLVVSDPRLWGRVGVTVEVSVVDRQLIVEARALVVCGRRFPLPRSLRRTLRRDVPAVPRALTVDRVAGHPDDPTRVIVHGSIAPATVDLDLARLLADLGSERALVALRSSTQGG